MNDPVQRRKYEQGQQRRRCNASDHDSRKRALFERIGMPDWHVEILLQFDRAFAEGWGARVSDVVEQVLARRLPRRYAARVAGILEGPGDVSSFSAQKIRLFTVFVGLGSRLRRNHALTRTAGVARGAKADLGCDGRLIP